MGTGHVSCELLRNAGSVFQCSGEAQWIDRDNVLVSLMVSESMKWKALLSTVSLACNKESCRYHQLHWQYSGGFSCTKLGNQSSLHPAPLPVSSNPSHICQHHEDILDTLGQVQRTLNVYVIAATSQSLSPLTSAETWNTHIRHLHCRLLNFNAHESGVDFRFTWLQLIDMKGVSRSTFHM